MQRFLLLSALFLAAVTAADFAPFIGGERQTTIALQVSYQHQVRVTGTTTAISATGLPSGLTMSEQGGISGTPTTVGSFPVHVTAINGTASASIDYTITVAPIVLRTWTVRPMLADLPNQQTLLCASATPATWSVASGSLPPGLSLDTATGVISGTPTTVGSSTCAVVVSNANGTSPQRTLDFRVMPKRTLKAWGQFACAGNISVPDGLDNVVQIAGGYFAAYALTNDGAVTAWWCDSANVMHVDTLPIGNATRIAPGIVLKSDGSVAPTCLLPTFSGYTPPTLPSVDDVVMVNGDESTFGMIHHDGAISVIGGAQPPLEAQGAIGISTRRNLCIALKPDRTVVEWGSVYGTTRTPSATSSATDVVMVASGGLLRAAVKSDGSSIQWGSFNPAHVPNDPGPIDELSVSTSHVMARLRDGSVAAWGDYPNEPCQTVLHGLRLVTAVAAGDLYSLALGEIVPLPPTVKSGKLWMQQGDGFTFTIAADENPTGFDASPLPPGLSLDASTGVISGRLLTAGDFTVTIGATNANGRGSSTLMIRSRPSSGVWIPYGPLAGCPRTVTGIRAIGAGDGNSVAVREDGTIASWGRAISGAPTGDSRISTLIAGNEVVLGLRDDGSLIGWGGDWFGQVPVPTDLGTGIRSAAISWYACGAVLADGSIRVWGQRAGYLQPPAEAQPAVAIAATGQQFVALRLDGSLVSWTDIGSGGGSGCVSIPNTVTDVRAIAASPFNVLALKNDGSVIGWNFNGPIAIPASFHGAQSIGAGYDFQVALMPDGTVRGNGIDGPALSGVVAINTGTRHVLALQSDGTVRAFGMNTWGQCLAPESPEAFTGIFEGSFASYPTRWAVRADGSVARLMGIDYPGGVPFPIDMTDVVALNGDGEFAMLALRQNGTIAGWGNSERLVIPGGLTNVVSMGGSLALHRNGTVTSWGANAPPGDLPPVSAIAANEYVGIALTSSGQVRTWTSINGNASAVTPPLGLDRVVAVTAGLRHLVALRDDGSVVAWGDNSLSQTIVPAGATDVVAVAACDFYTVALRGDGNVVMWGNVPGFGQVSSVVDLSQPITGIYPGPRPWFRTNSREAVSVGATNRTVTGYGSKFGLGQVPVSGHFGTIEPTVNQTFNGSNSFPSAFGTYAVHADVDTWGFVGFGDATLSIIADPNAPSIVHPVSADAPVLVLP
jgi:alpha-tubulin suppressor-like RCC1 family protein